ncbi:4-hydroxy-tetrahydrodipicolinate reductase, partial [candidate division WOR-3 bacterium]|nr:4-hydroxy-tetrahydrodipicolinate reductase [candidate division WOR-3 bacterium]MBD3363658.1 4-hydroxy-tetrahydrodipicolinate reductase [candidate division WOR-3 bacterium]
MIRVVVAGGAGRMAGEVARMVAEAQDMKLEGIVERADHPKLGETLFGVEVTCDLPGLLDKADVLVEFTSPPGLLDILDKITESPVSLVSGTTGLSETDFARLNDAGNNRVVFWAPNMSIGVNLLFKLTAQVTRALPDYDVEVLEMHHRHKKDAPSGTAAKLAGIIKENRKISKTVYGREGHTGERNTCELGILALRGGDVAGEHTVYFAT